MFDISTIGQERIVADIPTGLWPPVLTVGDDGDVWSFLDEPAALFRIDAETAKVVGRVPLDIPDGSFRDLTAGGGSLWVRLDGSLVEVTTDP